MRDLGSATRPCLESEPVPNEESLRFSIAGIRTPRGGSVPTERQRRPLLWSSFAPQLPARWVHLRSLSPIGYSSFPFRSS